ncbi:MAG: HAD family hydrolase [Thermaurantiacus sp.]
MSEPLAAAQVVSPGFRLPRPHALILDMDGLLLDTERLYLEVNVEAAAALGYALPTDTNMAMVGVAIDGCRRLLIDRLGTGFPFDRFRDLGYEIHDARMASGVPLRAGAKALVDWAQQEGLAMAVATSTQRARAEDHLERAGLREMLDVLVTRDDVVNAKPAPDPYLLAAERLGVAPAAALALEDSANGVRSAAAAGVPVVMVPDIIDPDEPVRALAHAVLPSLDAVLAALRGN